MRQFANNLLTIPNARCIPHTRLEWMIYLRRQVRCNTGRPVSPSRSSTTGVCFGNSTVKLNLPIPKAPTQFRKVESIGSSRLSIRGIAA